MILRAFAIRLQFDAASEQHKASSPVGSQSIEDAVLRPGIQNGIFVGDVPQLVGMEGTLRVPVIQTLNVN